MLHLTTFANLPFEAGSNNSFTKDYSGYSNNGTVTNAIYNSTGGHDGRGSYKFDTNGDFISLSYIPIFNTDNFTILYLVFYPADQ